MPQDAAVDRAVLLVGHGSVTDPEQIPAFLRRIRHGREPPPELTAEVTRRYAAIGGSPLLSVSRSLAEKLEAKIQVPCRLSMRFSDPFIADVLADLCARRPAPRRVCALPLSPYSVALYTAAVRAALPSKEDAPEIRSVVPYGESPELVRAHAERMAPILALGRREDTALVLTAHSLPVSVIAGGDGYAVEFEASARAVASALDWPFEVAYQSVGAGGGEWLGPTIAEALDGALRRGKKRVVVAPVGFLADHLETLYDLDIEAAALARDRGLEFARVPALNDDEPLVAALAAVVKRALE